MGSGQAGQLGQVERQLAFGRLPGAQGQDVALLAAVRETLSSGGPTPAQGALAWI